MNFVKAESTDSKPGRKSSTLCLISQERIDLYEKTIADLESKLQALEKPPARKEKSEEPAVVTESMAGKKGDLTPEGREFLSQAMKARWAARRRERARLARTVPAKKMRCGFLAEDAM